MKVLRTTAQMVEKRATTAVNFILLICCYAWSKLPDV